VNGGISLTSDFLRDAQSIGNWLIHIRRDIHRNPETGFNLERTASIVEHELARFGIPSKRLAKTGVMGILKGGKSGPVLGFRADMDALEMEDKKEVDYASRVPGCMHACGHDAHTSMLLGAARILAAKREQLCGEVKLFFQPAEETDGGALPMIREGAMKNPDVDAVFGIHVALEYPTGSIGLSWGKLHAASDMFDLTIKGKSSHGAEPHLGVDAIAIGSQLISALQHIVNRETDPLNSVVVTVGSFHAGTERNILAGKAEIRTLDPETHLRVRNRVRSLVDGVTLSMGAQVELRIIEGYPCVINDPTLAHFVESVSYRMMGPDSVNIIEKPSMGVDDFAYFIQEKPGVFFMLGVGNHEKGFDHPLHTNLFDIDEESLPMGAAILAQIAFDFSGQQSRGM